MPNNFNNRGRDGGKYGKNDRYNKNGANNRGPRANKEGEPAYFKDGQPVYRRDDTRRDDTRRDNNGGYKGDRNDRSGGYRNDRNDRNDRSGGYKGDRNDRNDRSGGYKGDRNDGGNNRYPRNDGRGGDTYGKKPDFRGKPEYRRDDRPAYGKPGNDKKPDYKRDRPDYNKPAENKRPTEAPASDRPNAAEDELPYLVMGRNAVREAIKSGRSIDRILVSRDPDGSLREIISAARDRNIRLDETDRQKLDELCMPFGHGGKTGNHQGIVALVPGVEYCEIADMLADAKAKNQKPFIILLDGIEDPHNLGSIIRSAVCAGAHGVVIPKRRAVSVTAAACKASAGATEYCRIARVPNIAGAMELLKKAGLWIAGADMKGAAMAEARMEGALALVIGSEGEGLSRLVRDKCDFTVSIPMYGGLDSLNASVAAAVLMFEKRRQDAAVK